MKKSIINNILFAFLLLCSNICFGQTPSRIIIDFNKHWKFFIGNDSAAFKPSYNDARWRSLHLPHDWSIESNFSKDFPATNQGGSLPGGIGWYRKAFILPGSVSGKNISIEFDGVYQRSEVWVNGNYIGKWNFGYTSFRYDLTKYLKAAPEKNLIAVRVDNSQQPNSRWYTGSGIYRDVKLVATNDIAFNPYGVFISTNMYSGDIGESSCSRTLRKGEVIGEVNIEASLRSTRISDDSVKVVHTIYDAAGKKVIASTPYTLIPDTSGVTIKMGQGLLISKPNLWSVDRPYLYKVVSVILKDNKAIDEVVTLIGIRKSVFDSEKGYFLNNKHLELRGVCMHHDLGALGAAFNETAARRQLRILKDMGCNAIRTAHNPPASKFLDLCDEMGFLVMDESFDMWKKRKNKFDYHLDFPASWKNDLESMVLRDRNHPSVIIWCIGNEIREQFDSTGIELTKELVTLVKSQDPTRPVTSALTENFPEKNFMYQSGALDVLGFNYKQFDYKELPVRFPGQKFIAAETVSALATRGVYDQPSDTMRIWPPDSKQPFTKGNPDMTVSAYDHAYAYWGTTHENALRSVQENPFLAGCFVWSGFDFLGEPVPYPWPARSSYYGIIDLAGFPKDVYYLYQSEWTTKPVLHIFPHWNHAPGTEVDVWAYYNNADEVELFLNNRSLGVRKKENGSMHVVWKVKSVPGILKAVSRKKGRIVLTRQIVTSGPPVRILLKADRKTFRADGKDLCFVTAQAVDKNGNPVPYADNLIKFNVTGTGNIIGTDNGYQADSVSLKSHERKFWKGMALVIIQSTEKKGNITLKADSAGLLSGSLTLKTSD